MLGALLIDAQCIPAVLQYLKPESFYRQQHRDIFSIIVRMFIASESIDFVTILEQVCREEIFPTDQDAKIYLTQLCLLYTSNLHCLNTTKSVDYYFIPKQ